MQGNHHLLLTAMILFPVLMFPVLMVFQHSRWELNHLSQLKIPQSHTSLRLGSLLAHHGLPFRACSSSFRALEALALNLSLLCLLLVPQIVFAVYSLSS